MLFNSASLVVITSLLLMPLAGHTQEVLAATTSDKTVSPQRVPIRTTTPPKIKTTVKPQQARSAGHQQPVCTGAPLPDIDVTDIRIDGPRKHGKSHNAEVYFVNSGQCATSKFTVKASMRIQASGVDKTVQLGTKGAPVLKPCRSKPCGDASHSVSFSFVPQYNHAFYDITVEVDAANVVNEYREDNNKIQGDLKIQNY